ncbi:MAG: sigma-70 family RNA polymerase sigma factor [Jatrophihabitans endophyticus]|nr:sigma-70 family RNA polymerase sigma factor [Jatrophihabitans endophyticus]
MGHRFEDVVAAEHGGLLRYATALAGDPDQAADMVQEVLTRAYQRWDTIAGTERPAAYLMTMVTNEFLSWRRRWHTRFVAVADDDALARATPATPGDHGEQLADRDDLERRLARLPRRQQAALVLRFYEGLDHDEAAAVLGCAPGTVRSLCSRGLAALRLDDAEPPAHPTRTPARLPATRTDPS